jgi:hypothetical protein
MPASARIYIAIVAALGFLALAGSFTAGGPPDWPRFLTYLALALIASALKVRLPGVQGTISLNFLVYLLAVAQLTLRETLVLAVVGTVVQTLWRARRRPRPVQVLFNVAAVMISLAAAFWFSHVWGPEPGLPELGLASVIFYALNTVLVSAVIAMVQESPFASILNRCHLWTVPYYLAGAVIALSVVASEDRHGWQVSLLLLPLMYLVYRHFRLLVATRGEIVKTSG